MSYHLCIFDAAGRCSLCEATRSEAAAAQDNVPEITDLKAWRQRAKEEADDFSFFEYEYDGQVGLIDESKAPVVIVLNSEDKVGVAMSAHDALRLSRALQTTAMKCMGLLSSEESSGDPKAS